MIVITQARLSHDGCGLHARAACGPIWNG